MRRLIASATGLLRIGGLAASLLIAVAGCHGHGTVLTNANCSAIFAPVEGVASVTAGPSGGYQIEFGPLLLGLEEQQQILISNVGLAPLHPGVQLTPEGSGFSAELSSAGPLQPGAPSLVLTVRFHPTSSGSASAQVAIATDCPGGSSNLTLKGEGYQPLLVLDPPVLDFGRVLLGSQESRDLKVTNDSDLARALTLFPLQGTGSSLFRLMAVPPPMLAPHQQITLTVVFRPTEANRVPIRSALAVALDCTGCEAQVDLNAQGVLTGLSVTPNPIDFGAVTPLDTATATLVLENVANAPITLLAVPQIVQPSPNAFQLGSPAPVADTILQAGDKVLVPLTFTAGALGPHEATLMLTTNDPYQGNVAVPIAGISGGPVLRCTPDTVAFGQVGVGTPAMARVTCVNAGMVDDTGGSQNLFLEIGTDSSDFSAVFDSPLPPDGLWPGPLSKAVIDVTFRPSAARAEQGNLVITSENAIPPVLLIPLQGTGLSLPPCVFSVQPARVDFGQVARGLSRDAQFVIADTGTVDCLINGIDLSPSSDASFTLPQGRVASQRLSPVGSSSGFPSQLRVPVRFTPPLNHSTRYTPGVDASSFAGQVQFAISDPNAPQQSVSLSGLSPDDCLVFDPVTPDLGAVPYDSAHQRWCSATRTLQVTNLCDQDATLEAAYFDGGSAAFSISGPGGAAGPWTIPPLLDGGAAPVAFQLTFRPSSAGPQIATLGVQSSQMFPNQTIANHQDCLYTFDELPIQTATREVASGMGLADGGQVDKFTGRGAQVDLLWIVDVMDPVGWQLSPSDLAPFLQYPISNGIDYQMAVTSSSAVGAAPAPFVIQDFGYLEPCDHCWTDGGAATIVVPGSTPDPASVLSPLLSIGGGLSPGMRYDVDCPGFDDQFFESFTEAFQPDLMAGHNAGFLRPNSVLAVIVLGDDDNDESDGSFSFYFNFLAGIRGRDRVSFSFAGNPSNDPSNPYDMHDRLPGLLAQLTGGVSVDASQAGWMGQLAQIWVRIADQVLRYPLSSLPADPNPYNALTHPGGLRVTVGGKAVADTSWHYDAADNAVIFDPATAPAAGAALTVGYALGCGG